SAKWKVESKFKSGKLKKFKVGKNCLLSRPSSTSPLKSRRHPSCELACVPPHDLRERTRLFALAVVAFCWQLPRTAEAQEAAMQLRRAANSVRSNYRVA